MVKISFKIYGEFKSFTDKQKLREFSTTRLVLQQILKGLTLTGLTKRKERPTKTNPKQSR